MKPYVLNDIAGLLNSDAFYDPWLARLYGHLVSLWDAGHGRVDIPLLQAAMRQNGGWTDADAARIAELFNGHPDAANAAAHARQVVSHAKLRQLRDAGLELFRQAQGASEEPEAILERAEGLLSNIKLTEADGEPVTMRDAAMMAIDHIDEIQRRGHSGGVPTGLSSFDLDQGGLFPGELAILAARPGCGKTSLALQIASHNAERGRLIYFASLEMSAVELSIRLACGESGVSNRLVRIGKFADGDSKRLSDALAKQSKAALEIHDRSSLSIASIRREIRKRKKRGLTLAVVDYLQLIQPDDRRAPREQQVARMVRSLKETAREYEIPILCLCQLNRQADGDEAPRLSQLRESGAIEQDADVVLFLSKHEPTENESHNAVLTIAKNRNGECGPLRLDWDAERTRFSVPFNGIKSLQATHKQMTTHGRTNSPPGLTPER